MRLSSDDSWEKPQSNHSRSYRDYVKVLSTRNPCLLNLVHFLDRPSDPSSWRPPRNFTLDFYEGEQHPIRRQFSRCDECFSTSRTRPSSESDLEGVQSHHGQLQGRVLIVEDLDQHHAEFLGSKLNIDPLFFALHLQKTSRDLRSQAPVDATLPSRFFDQNFVNTAYYRPLMRERSFSSEETLVRDMNIDRELVFIHSTTIGLARHGVSVFKTQQSSDIWIALLLVDPPLGNLYCSDDTLYPSERKKDKEAVRLQLRPFLGGPEDFVDRPKFSEAWSQQDEYPPEGMAHKDPTLLSLAYYPLRIVAAEWVKYIAVMHHCFEMYEHDGDHLANLDRFNTDLRDPHRWWRRSIVSQQNVRAVINQLKHRQSPDLDHLADDFETISVNIKNAGKRLEGMVPIMTSLVQIIDARKSFAETTNISRLTVLALVFVPMSFVSSLFSMNDANRPGASDFWVYFAVAVPITLLVCLVARPPTI